MKKLIAIVLSALLVLGMAACGAETAEPTGTTAAPTQTTASPVVASSALEVLEKTWALYAEEEKFFAMGGDFNAPVDGGAGPVDLGSTDFLTFNMLVPEAETANVMEAASLVHGMNANTFTGGAYAVSNVEAFAAAMQTAIQGNQWMCGFPETLLIANVAGYAVVVFGLADQVSVFQTHLGEAFPGYTTIINEPIG